MDKKTLFLSSRLLFMLPRSFPIAPAFLFIKKSENLMLIPGNRKGDSQEDAVTFCRFSPFFCFSSFPISFFLYAFPLLSSDSDDVCNFRLLLSLKKKPDPRNRMRAPPLSVSKTEASLSY
ncbi:hypothetical protein GOBAR_AA00630 [Gossypium barbadense]|uniref:Uncharacterized protein n=1 Tax=Gossypium barbadense TaxID=3634 RepID=A0A2P5YWM0_GOSBA|nr:hypothetical protein GOBAR_AA00630 [Gossypium barbadense]